MRRQARGLRRAAKLSRANEKHFSVLGSQKRMKKRFFWFQENSLG
jgi:hypothetical protein